MKKRKIFEVANLIILKIDDFIQYRENDFMNIFEEYNISVEKYRESRKNKQRIFEPHNQRVFDIMIRFH